MEEKGGEEEQKGGGGGVSPVEPPPQGDAEEEEEAAEKPEAEEAEAEEDLSKPYRDPPPHEFDTPATGQKERSPPLCLLTRICRYYICRRPYKIKRH